MHDTVSIVIDPSTLSYNFSGRESVIQSSRIVICTVLVSFHCFTSKKPDFADPDEIVHVETVQDGGCFDFIMGTTVERRRLEW